MSEPANVTVFEPRTALVAPTPADILHLALTRGDIEIVKEVMALQRQERQEKAREAFDEALAGARTEIKPIKKNRQVGFDSKKAGAARTDYMHEDLAEIARTIDDALSKRGLSYRWRTTSNLNEPITVTCIVFGHGHSIENTLMAGRDDSGNKNSIQAIGSTVTYLQRYTLKAALGLAAAEDDDGKTAGNGTPISAEQLEKIQALIVETGSDIPRFCKYFKVEKIDDIPASRFNDAIAALEAKRAKA